jgi:hypothetical protein
VKPRKPRDVAASVHQRLLNMARQTDRPFNELLQHYAIERFLYRLARSSHADKFILKGALMLAVWKAPVTRPTMDIDLLGKTENDIGKIASLTREICRHDVEPDGMRFDAETVAGERIAEDADYAGVRVRFRAYLGNARVGMQLDIGFGDIVVPDASIADFPAILDFPAPRIRCYSRESTIAEKFEAMASLGVLNSRMKDFFDIWALSRQFDFEGEQLGKAIAQTFARRGTVLPEASRDFLSEIARDDTKAVQWQAFLRKGRLAGVPEGFEEVAKSIAEFLHPVASAVASRRSFLASWKAPGPWREQPSP